MPIGLDLTRLMSLEVIGIKEGPEDDQYTFAENEAIRILNEKTKYDAKSKTYVTTRPWTRDGPPPCTNKGAAERFATKLARRLEKASSDIRDGWLNAYGNGIQNWFLQEIESLVYYVKRPLRGFLKEISKNHLFSSWIENTCLCIVFGKAFSVQTISYPSQT